MNDRVTLNPGIRFNFNRGSVPEQGTVLSTNPVAPRIGVAWDLTGNHKTVLRGHYGRYFDALLGNTYEFMDVSELCSQYHRPFADSERLCERVGSRLRRAISFHARRKLRHRRFRSRIRTSISFSSVSSASSSRLSLFRCSTSSGISGTSWDSSTRVPNTTRSSRSTPDLTGSSARPMMLDSLTCSIG